MQLEAKPALSFGSSIKKLLPSAFEKYGIVAILLGLIVVFGTLNPAFLSLENMLNVARQISIFGIMAAGMTFVIVSGQIDLSVGSVVALTGVIAAIVVKHGYGLVVAVSAGLLVGALVGFINGYLTVRFNVPSLLITLGTMSAIRGFGYVITDGRPVWGLPRWFGSLGGGYMLGVPIPVIVLIGAYVIGWFVLNLTVFGRYVYSTGDNREGARLCGINTEHVIVGTLCISGMAAGLSGVIWASRLASGQPLVGQGYELQVIAATVMGGSSLSGGQGEIIGSLIGAFIMGVLYNGLNLLRVSPYWQMVGTGFIVMLAVILDSIRRGKR